MIPAFRIRTSRRVSRERKSRAAFWIEGREERSHSMNVIGAFGMRDLMSWIAAKALDSLRVER